MNKSKEMVSLAIKAIEDKKGNEIKVIDIHNVSVIADYFIIASGSNRNQVQTISDNVEDTLGRAGFEPRQIEGYHTAAWILLDYNDIIVHVFSEEDREFYDLERIWRDGEMVDPEQFKSEN